MTAVLTAEEMRAAERASGVPVPELMERAGLGLAEAAWRYAGPLPTLILCGPGNNGGDGYVAARHLRARGVSVEVAALGEAKAGAAADARAAWDGPVATFAEAAPAPLLIDALFGTGLTRPLDASVASRLAAFASAARVRVAADLPSGIETDTGACLGPVPAFDLTVAFGALKPAHLLFPAAGRCGRTVVVGIGVGPRSRLHKLEPWVLPPPGPQDHKYTRGQVAVIAGAMPGAAELAALGAARAGAGYVLLLGSEGHATPHAIVRSGAVTFDYPKLGAIVVGPGLGRDFLGKRRLKAAVAAGKPLVIDGDALHLLDRLDVSASSSILTPHEGEFRALFPGLDQPSKLERARAAAARSGAVIVYKGPDTVIAAPDGRAAIAADASPWLSTAGTGDVLAGAIGAMRARGLEAFEAAQAGVWLHAEAARRLGPAFLADDLARAL